MITVDRRFHDQPIAATWTLSRTAKPGDDDPLHILDRPAGAEKRVICTILGKLAWRPSDDTFVRLLDAQDIENARAIAALPKMRRVLADLVAWAAETGPSNAPCWDAARALLGQPHEPTTPE